MPPQPAVPRRFRGFGCFDWSGAAVARPPGIACATCGEGGTAPVLLTPEGGWTRHAALAWLRAQADAQADLLIGIDFSAALPFADRGAYFPGWSESPAGARGLWALAERLGAGDPHLAAGALPDHPEASRHYRRHGGRRGDLFEGSEGRFRVTERAARAQGVPAVSSLNLVGAAQVGKASLSGMRLLHRLGGRLPVWPFDPVPRSGPLIVEIYTGIAARDAGGRRGRSKLRDAAALDAALAALGSTRPAPLARYDDHSTDAMLGAAWLRYAARDPALWHPPALDPALAASEGWTFGVR